MSASSNRILDGHNDCILSMYLQQEPCEAFYEGRGKGHIDLPRARQSGFNGGFFAMFTPPPFQQQPRSGEDAAKNMIGRNDPRRYETPSHANAREFSLRLFNMLDELIEMGDGELKQCRSVQDIDSCLGNNLFGVIPHFEGAEAIAVDLNDLDEWYDRGLRSLGPVWSRSNDFAHGVPFAFPHSPDTGPGLTDAGKHLVRACNHKGIMVDLAHMNERGFWDVEAICDAPLVVTHSCAHALTPSTRNLTDKQLDAIKSNRGIVGCNFNTPDVRADGQRLSDTPLARVVEHIDYMVNRIGIEHVAFGSDFDGAQMPDELGDVAGMSRLIDLLHDAGYDDDSIARLSHKNWQRILRETWK